MALPQLMRVKLLSDDAGAISFSRVLVRDMSVEELLGLIISQVGKDPARIRRMLRSGTLVSGASRYRWEPCEAEDQELDRLLAAYPDATPDRQFSGELCTLVAIHLETGGRLEVPRDKLNRRRFLRRRSFWDELLRLTDQQAPEYIEYSYRERADCYRLSLTAENQAVLREAAELLTYSALMKRLRLTGISAIDLYVCRTGSRPEEQTP